MSDDRGRGIGIGAPGLGAPLPSTDASCTATVRTSPPPFAHRWDGYTAAEACTRRTNSLREAGLKPTRRGNTITWAEADGTHVEIQFTDNTPPTGTTTPQKPVH